MPGHRFSSLSRLLRPAWAIGFLAAGLLVVQVAGPAHVSSAQESTRIAVGEIPPAEIRLRRVGTTDDAGLVAVGETGRERPRVLVYRSSRCPVSERYAKTLLAAVEDLGTAADLVLVVTDGDASEADLTETLSRQGLALPVLRDTEGAAKRLGVRVTPTVLLLAADGTLRYRGPIDNDRRARGKDSRALLVPAVRAVVAGRAVEPAEARPFGSALR